MTTSLSAIALLLAAMPCWAVSHASPRAALIDSSAGPSVIRCPAVDAIHALPHGVFSAALGSSDSSTGTTGEWLGFAAPGSRPAAFEGALIIRTEPSLPDVGVFNGCLYRMDHGAALKLRLERRDTTPLNVAVVDPVHWQQDGHLWLACSSTDPAYCGMLLMDPTRQP